MFEWIDKSSGKTIRLSPDEAAELLNKSFGRRVRVKRRGSRWLAVAASAGLLLLAATSWEFEERVEVGEEMVKREKYVELFSWDLPPYRTEMLSRSNYTNEFMANSKTSRDGNSQRVFEIRDGKLVKKDTRIEQSRQGQSASNN